MGKYTLKRLLIIIPLVLCVTIIVFLLINAVPGDPGRMILGIGATQEQVDALNEALGYNQPLAKRLLDYLGGLTRFDLGTSYQNGEPVLKIILGSFPYTLKLAVFTTLLYSVLGITLGVLSAVKQYSALDNIVRVISIALSAFPGFWVYMFSILVFSLYLGWLPTFGVTSWTGYILPIAVGGILSASSLQRLTRTTMLESIRADYVRTARAKGLSETRVIWRHAFLNAVLPIINQVGINFGMMLGGTVIAESIFTIPGLGTIMINSIMGKDVPVVMGCTIFLSLIFCVLVVLLDVLAAAVDPRVKAKLAGKG